MSPKEARALTSLPSRPALHPGQALDCYLEHVADANYLSAGTLMSSITAATDTTRYVLLRATPRTLDVLAGLTGQSPDMLAAATLAPLDGTLVDLTGLDPTDQTSYRAVAARGWAPGQGTAICPQCLAENGTWDIAWRLPTSTVCLRHRTYLLSSCPTCGKPFRAARSTLLRPVGAALRCGNAAGRRGRYCAQDLTTLSTARADPGCVIRQAVIDPQALATVAPPVVFGDTATPRELVADVKSLTTLLLHIATATTRGGLLPAWAAEIHAATHALARAHRWGLRPPADIAIRSRAMTAAAEILTSGDMETATARFGPWYEAIPPTPDGLLGWAGDHTRHTPATTRLITATHAPRRRFSRLLDTRSPLTVSTGQIPQLLPVGPYEAHLAALFTSSHQTVRLFASLTMARTHPGISTWSDAAAALGLHPESGPRCAAAAAASQTASPTAVLAAITATVRDLDERDYRTLEDQIRALAASASWFTTWCRRHRPGTRAASRPLAVQWLWTHVAHAHPATAPDADPVRARRFAATLTPAQGESLSRVLHHLGDIRPGLVEGGNAPTTRVRHERSARRRKEGSTTCA